MLAVVLAGAVSLLGTISAFANHPILSGQVAGACNSQGQFVITWTVQNSETTTASGGSGRTMRIDALTSLPIKGRYRAFPYQGSLSATSCNLSLSRVPLNWARRPCLATRPFR